MLQADLLVARALLFALPLDRLHLLRHRRHLAVRQAREAGKLSLIDLLRKTTHPRANRCWTLQAMDLTCRSWRKGWEDRLHCTSALDSAHRHCSSISRHPYH